MTDPRYIIWNMAGDVRGKPNVTFEGECTEPGGPDCPFPRGPSIQIIPIHWALKSVNITFIGLFGSLGILAWYLQGGNPSPKS